MLTVKTAPVAPKVEAARETISVEKLRSDLDSAIAKSPGCRKVDVIHGLISIVHDMVLADVTGKPLKFSNDNKAGEPTLRDKLQSTLEIERLIKRYGRGNTKQALILLIDGMVKNIDAPQSGAVKR